MSERAGALLRMSVRAGSGEPVGAAFKSVREDAYVRACGTKKILSTLYMHTPERESERQRHC